MLGHKEHEGEHNEHEERNQKLSLVFFARSS